MPSVSQFNVDSPTVASEKTEIVRLLNVAYGYAVGPTRLDRFLACEPGGWSVVHHDSGALVGVGGTIAYPDAGFGWIGLIATDPTYERQGIGRLATEACVAHLRSRNCAPVLDASAAGAPLYRRMGFADKGQSILFTHDGKTFPEVPKSVTNPAAISAAEFDQLVAYDFPRFGADRSRLLAYLGNEFPGRIFLSFDTESQADGETILNGFAVAQDVTIGPVVADSPNVVTALLAAAITAPFTTRPRLPFDADSSYRAEVAACGFIFIRSLDRQLLGIDRVPGRRDLLCAQTSLGEG